MAPCLFIVSVKDNPKILEGAKARFDVVTRRLVKPSTRKRSQKTTDRPSYLPLFTIATRNYQVTSLTSRSYPSLVRTCPCRSLVKNQSRGQPDSKSAWLMPLATKYLWSRALTVTVRKLSSLQRWTENGPRKSKQRVSMHPKTLRWSSSSMARLSHK